MRVCTQCKLPVRDGDVQCPDDAAETRSEAVLPEGTRLGAYTVLRLLGRGGMGEVYEARHEELNKRAAIKLLPKRMAMRGSFGERFVREAKAASRVEHPSIISIYDLGNTPDGSAYMVMEMLDGAPLEALLKGERLPLQQALHIAHEAAKALGAAHARGIVHRDFKPGNVFVLEPDAERPRVKVLDFGIAYLKEQHGPRLTRAGTIMGTPHYMPPEQATAKSTDARSDVYSWGCVVYHLVTGTTPFRHKGIARLLAAQAVEEAEPPSSRNPEVPPELDAIVARCMQKKPEHRYQSMGEATADLLPLLPAQVQPFDLRLLIGHPARRRSTRAFPSWLLPALAITLVLAGGALWWMVSSLRTDGETAEEPDEAVVAGADGARDPARADIGTAEPAAVSDEQLDRAQRLLRDSLAAVDAADRSAAVAALGEVPSDGGMSLAVELLAEAPAEEARAAILLLGSGRSKHAREALRRAFARGEVGVRLAAAAELARAGDAAGRDLLLAAADRGDLEPAERALVGLGLATLGERAGVALLGRLLRESSTELHPAIVAEAWGLIAASGDTAARGRLRGRITAGTPLERLLAAEALLRIDDLAGRAALVGMLSAKDVSVRVAAADALAIGGDVRGLVIVDDAVHSTDPEVRRIAVATLGKIGAAIGLGHVEALDTMMDSSEEPPGVRLTAAAAVLAVAEAVRAR